MKKILSAIVAAFCALSMFAADLVPQEQLNGKFAYVNPLGLVVIRAKFDSARKFREGLAAVEINGKWGFINEQGRTVVKCKYQEVRDFNGGYAIVKSKGLWGAVDTAGEEAVPCMYENPNDLADIKVLILNSGEKYIIKGD